MKEIQPMTDSNVASELRIFLEGEKINPPKDLHLQNGETLAWTAPDDTSELTRYQLTYMSATNPHTQATDTDRTSISIPTSLNETAYSVSLRATKNGNYSAAANTLSIQFSRSAELITTATLQDIGLPRILAINGDDIYLTKNVPPTGNHTSYTAVVKGSKTKGKISSEELGVTTGPLVAAVDMVQQTLYVCNCSIDTAQWIVKIPLSGSGGGTDLQLSHRLDNPNSLAVDLDSLYVTGWDEVKKIPKNGGQVTDAFVTNLSRPLGMAVDGNDLYIACSGNGTVVKAPKAGGGQATPVITNLATPTSVAVDGNDLYIACSGNGTVVKAPKAGGGQATPVITNLATPTSVAVDGNDLYIACSGIGKVVKAPKKPGWFLQGNSQVRST
ncbi:hypothetical protein [Streptomyces sp. FIT100]|uniref:hypothetical protein n=1 Tax=Streptomyces sp. FIT100 TaxID=2837956 RepID=UPI0021C7BE85|nr:hypothetical protein [Streptomyces sp. FIT100]UUN30667.1 hypothetical protein KK483_33290 [Streptomyces sp. FIT100]